MTHINLTGWRPYVANLLPGRVANPRPFASLNQSQTQLTRPLATCLGMQRTPGFWFGHVQRFGRSKAISIPNFDQNKSQCTAEILLLPVSENRLPPYRNFTFGFDFDLFTAIAMWFSIGTPNFIEIGLSAAEL